MSYTIDRLLEGLTLPQAEERTRAALAANAFGVITEIDIAATMKAKLGLEMAPYKILGACSPKYAAAILAVEPKAGSMLPCNIVLREVPGGVEVNAVDPVASMAAIEAAALAPILDEVRGILARAIAAI